MLISLKNLSHYTIHDIHGEYFDRESLDFPGRIWKKHRVLTFWVFPEKNEFFSIVRKLSKLINEDILNTYKERCQ